MEQNQRLLSSTISCVEDLLAVLVAMQDPTNNKIIYEPILDNIVNICASYRELLEESLQANDSLKSIHNGL